MMLITEELLYYILKLEDPVEWRSKVFEENLKKLSYDEIIEVLLSTKNSIYNQFNLNRRTGKTTNILIEAMVVESHGFKSLILYNNQISLHYSKNLLADYKKKIFNIIPGWKPNIEFSTLGFQKPIVTGNTFYKVFQDI